MSELFQLREAEELDFGIYRVIRRHNQQVRAFLGEIVEESGQPVLRGGELAGIFPKITIACWFMPKMRNAGSRNCCLAPPKWKRDIAIPIMTRVVSGNREIFPLVIPTVKAVIPLPALPGESFLARRRVLIGVYRKTKFGELDRDRRIWWGENGSNIPAIKRFQAEVKQGRVPQTIWFYQQVGHTQDAKKELLAYTTLSESESVFQTPKPTALIRRVLSLATEAIGADEWVLDFFAGSGTTGHAVLAQNHADGGSRKFLLVECNAYFDTLLLPHLKRAARSPEWKESDPTNGPGLFMRVQRLEQYEDTLENLAVAVGENQKLFAGAEALAYDLDAEAKRLLFASQSFTAPFGLTLKRIAGADLETDPVDLVESLVYLLGQAELLFGELGKGLTLHLVDHYRGFLLAILPPGAFIGLGCLITIKNVLDARARRRLEPKPAVELREASV